MQDIILYFFIFIQFKHQCAVLTVKNNSIEAKFAYVFALEKYNIIGFEYLF